MGGYLALFSFTYLLDLFVIDEPVVFTSSRSVATAACFI
jgi:hypothetical protein